MGVWAFGAAMFSSACLNNLFVTYYLELFMYVAKIEPRWFYIGQIVFMIWNSVNDPLFGWLSDKFSTFSFRKNNRLGAIRYGGWLWVLSFLYVWWIPDRNNASQAMAGIHFIFSLCFYDGMLTYVEVNHSALLAELSSSESVRANANMYAAICAGIGSLSAFFSHYFWSRIDLYYFQVYCFVIGIFALIGFEITAHLVDIPKRTDGKYITSNDKSNDFSFKNKKKRDGNTNNSQLTFMSFVKQMSSSSNFVYFAFISLLQVFDCTFGKNFLSIFLSDFSGNSLSTRAQGFVVSLSFVLPWICTVILTPLVQKLGVYTVIKRIFLVRLCIISLGILFTFVYGRTSWVYLCINRIASECICRFMPLVKSNLVDEDTYLNKRKRSMSSSVIGSSDFLAKSGQSLAPMLGFYIINKNVQNGNSIVGINNSTYWPSMSIALIPGLVVISQFFLWNKFTLRGKYLDMVRENKMDKKELSSV